MDIIYSIDLLGTMVFAISGAMAANRKGIDVFGATFTGFVTAIGGGSLRDVFLNLRPIWVDDGNYLIAILIGVFISIVANKRLDRLARTLTFFDAIGIGFFLYRGCSKILITRQFGSCRSDFGHVLFCNGRCNSGHLNE